MKTNMWPKIVSDCCLTPKNNNRNKTNNNPCEQTLKTKD